MVVAGDRSLGGEGVSPAQLLRSFTPGTGGEMAAVAVLAINRTFGQAGFRLFQRLLPGQRIRTRSWIVVPLLKTLQKQLLQMGMEHGKGRGAWLGSIRAF